MAYTPDATNVAQPADTGINASTAANEFRTIKLYLRDILLAGLAGKAGLASPAFTGTPTGPTAAVDTNTTQLATTAYVIGQSYLKAATAASTYAPLASPSLTGTPTGPTAAPGTSTTQLATTAFVTTADNLKANIASPSLTGTPLSTTAAVDTNTTQIATTAYVIGQSYLKASTAASTYAPLASPSLTGTPTAPTAAVDTNTTQLATTAYVIGQSYLKSSTAASTYAPLGGAGTSGSWGISVTGSSASCTGNAATATTATTASNVSAAGQVGGIEIGFRRAVAGSTTAGTLAATDSGKGIYATGTITIPNSTFQQGDILSIYNNSGSAVTITISVATNWYNGISAGGSKSLAARKFCSVLFISSTECVLTGDLT
jgi:hypothetical protein